MSSRPSGFHTDGEARAPSEPSVMSYEQRVEMELDKFYSAIDSMRLAFLPDYETGQGMKMAELERSALEVEKSKMEAAFLELAAMDPLAFFKANEGRLPILSALARRILCIPITSVTCESFFSITARILTDARTCMSLETFEQLAILKANSISKELDVDVTDFLLDFAKLAEVYGQSVLRKGPPKGSVSDGAPAGAGAGSGGRGAVDVADDGQ